MVQLRAFGDVVEHGDGQQTARNDIFILDLLRIEGVAGEVGWILNETILEGGIIRGYFLEGLASFKVEAAMSFNDINLKRIISSSVIAIIRILITLAKDIILNCVLWYLIEIGEVGLDEGDIIPDETGIEIEL
jgi:hypothetical protein